MKTEVQKFSQGKQIKNEKKIIKKNVKIFLGLGVMESPSRKFSKIAPAPKDSPLATQVFEWWRIIAPPSLASIEGFRL